MIRLKPGISPVLVCFAILASQACGFSQDKKGKLAAAEKWKIDTVVRGITIPFGMAFLPNGEMLVTDRSDGKIYLVSGKQKQAIGNLPEVHSKDQGGMMDIALHPDYPAAPWIYYAYSAVRDGKNGTVVERAKLDGKNLGSREVLFTTHPFFTNGAHYGCRLALKDGFLFITIGERYSLKDSAQLLANHLGKILRLKDDGTVPADNPFVNQPGALPQIWSYGHRNPQGLAFHPSTGELWEGEHGPKGGDELNLIKPGKNYGWPVITYGVDYSGEPVGEGITAKAGMEQPIHYYKPSIGPSGMVFYTGNAIPEWKGSLFQGALALNHLNRIVLEGNKVVKEERLFENKGWRVRNVVQGPDGFLYIAVDGGTILRIRPAH